MGTFGLRNKRELWRAQTELSSIRKQARFLLAATEQVRLREEKKLLDSLRRRGLVSETATLDDILSLTVEELLSRRLQTLVFKKGMAVSPLHARQLVTHGHVSVGARRVTVPGYEVSHSEEGQILLTGGQGPPKAEAKPVDAGAEAGVAPEAAGAAAQEEPAQQGGK